MPPGPAGRFEIDLNELERRLGHPPAQWEIRVAQERGYPPDPEQNGEQSAWATRPPIERFLLHELTEKYPHLHAPVVNGLFRERETVNVISTSKVGKSWLAYSLALSIVTGRHWLERFATSAGRVLLIDNELHRPTLAFRIPTVADALAIPAKEYEHDMEIWPLRGNLRNIFEIGDELDRIDPGTFKAVIIDAKYRMIVPGRSENDNAAETHFYNAVDAYAERTGASFVLVHHASKGAQGDKRTTDVGAGAGAQSRAADCHNVLREHEEPNVAVLDAALRSFPPVEPVALRWSFPLWTADESLDTGRLKGRLTIGEQRQSERDSEGLETLREALREGPATPKMLRGRTGLGKARVDRLLDVLEAAQEVSAEEVKVRGQWTRRYTLEGCPF